MEKSRNYLSKMDFEDEEDENSFDLNYIARDLDLSRKDDEFNRQPIKSSPESEGSIEMPQTSRALIEEPFGPCRVESTLRRTETGDLEDPPTYFPLVIRKIAKHTKGAREESQCWTATRRGAISITKPPLETLKKTHRRSS